MKRSAIILAGFLGILLAFGSCSNALIGLIQQDVENATKERFAKILLKDWEDNEIPLDGSYEYDFQSVATNSWDDFLVYIWNAGDGDLELKGPPTVSPANVDTTNEFTTQLFGSSVVKPGGFTSFMVKFDPTAIKPGYTATVTLKSNDPKIGTCTFTVTGEGIGEDHVNPTIVADSETPANGSDNVPISTNVTITFNEKMDLDSLQSAFTLSKGVESVPAEVSLSDDGVTATLDPSANLEPDTLYTAEVTTAAEDRANNTLASGKTWSFTTLALPEEPHDPSPGNPTSNVEFKPTLTLNWADSAWAATYYLYLDTNNPPKTGIYKGSDSTFTLKGDELKPGTTYNWQVVARNSSGSTKGDVWSFTTLELPAKPSSPKPSSGSENQSVFRNLDWADVERATSYDVYYGQGTGPKVVYTLIGSGIKVSYFRDLDQLNYGEHSWYVVARNNAGTTQGPVWTFTTHKDDWYPAEGAKAVSLYTELDWLAAKPTTYRVTMWVKDEDPVQREFDSYLVPPNPVLANQFQGQTVYWYVEYLDNKEWKSVTPYSEKEPNRFTFETIK